MDNRKTGRSTTWVKGMKSPNPKGRPPGITDRRRRISEELLDAAGKVNRVVIDAALGGDMQAAQLVLSRVTPVLRAQSQTVEFNFDAAASLATQVEQVLAAIASGDVSPDTGKSIVESIGALAAVRQVDELARRLDALEGRAPQ